MKTWVYAWQSPDRKWASFFQFKSYDQAKRSAVHSARVGSGRSRPWRSELEPKHTEKLWRSLRRDGWRIRRKRPENVA